MTHACLAALALPDRLGDAYQPLPGTLSPVPGSIAGIHDQLAVLPDLEDPAVCS